MKAKIINNRGITFVELLLYIAIFLIITPVLLSVSINSARQEKTHISEKQVNADSQYMMERIYDIIGAAKKIDVANSKFDDANGKITLIKQDDSTIVIELDAVSKKVRITEGGQTSELSSADTDVQSIYFERITSDLNDPDIVLGINVRMNLKGTGQYDVVQNYVTSANLERGDFDGDSCPDYLDRYPKHAECCGDADGDGICDEMDNCIMTFNPFQEDFDADDIGDACDNNVYLGDGGEGGGGGGGGAFNCSSDDQLIALINQQPPMNSVLLKQILVSSSPLPPTVLHEAILQADLLRNIDFRAVFIKNVLLPSEIYSELMAAPNVANSSKVIIGMAQLLGKFIPWLGNQENTSTYQVVQFSEMCGEEEYTDSIKFSDSTRPLPTADMGQYSDVFVISVSGGTDTVDVTTQTASGTATSTLTGGGDYENNSLGFMVSMESITGNSYAFTVNSISNTQTLASVTFDFGCGATVVSPTSTYVSKRYVCYCTGGCADDCGDGGTGIITTNVYTDKCYRWNFLFPEWCSKWETFKDDNSVNPAYLGGTTTGEETAYWEKTFKSMLTNTQMAALQSITVGGEIAYQSTAQFFCDTLGSQCPMKGNLVGAQNIELYNWETSQWDVIGVVGRDGTISDQQKYEVKYSGLNPQKYFGSTDNRVLMARMEYHWNGVAPQGQTSAPAFMCIDYFTVHLKW